MAESDDDVRNKVGHLTAKVEPVQLAIHLRGHVGLRQPAQQLGLDEVVDLRNQS